MQVALTPMVPADLKLVADEVLCNRLETISSGEKLTLAHRPSGRVAGELLRDGEARVVHAAFENPWLTEWLVIRALRRSGAPAALVEAICHHAQWSLPREVRVALLRNENTPMARAIKFARTMPVAQVRETLQNSQLPGKVKAYLLTDLERNGLVGLRDSRHRLAPLRVRDLAAGWRASKNATFGGWPLMLLERAGRPSGT